MSERKQGWYWARPSSEWVLPDQDWEPCEFNENGQWVFLHYEKGWQLLDDSAFDEIGPRIPTPDEMQSAIASLDALHGIAWRSDWRTAKNRADLQAEADRLKAILASNE